MPKKTAKQGTSWRTLMRRAKDEEKAGKPNVAAALRAKAANLRKPRQPAKKRSTTRRSEAQQANDYATSVGAEMTMAAQSMNTALYGDHENASRMRTPGHGEIVGGAEHQLAELIFSTVRKKGGKDEVTNLLTTRIAAARAEGQNLAQAVNRKAMVELHERIDERIVCAFLAEVNIAQQFSNGLPPDQVWSVNSLTVAKICDALNKAGYTPKGKS